MRRRVSVLLAAFVIFAAAMTSVQADDHNGAVTILKASVSADQSTLSVVGSGFGMNPAVFLDGIAIGPVTVNVAGRALSVPIPALEPGSYALVIVRTEDQRQRDEDDRGAHVGHFVVTVGAVGPAGPIGPQGPPGITPTELADLQQQLASALSQISALSNQVASLGQASPLNLYVDCGSGETVGGALAQAQGHVGPVNITVSGTCTESVAIDRDDVTLSGQTSSSGIQAPSGQPAILMQDANRTLILRLTLTGATGSPTVQAFRSSFGMDGVTIHGGDGGVSVETGNGRLSNTTIESTTIGITAGPGGNLNVSNNSSISNNSGHGVFGNGGTVQLNGISVTHNGGAGVFAWLGSTVTIQDSQIDSNTQTGLTLLSNATAILEGGSEIADNGQDGVSVQGGSVAQLMNATVDQNQGDGIRVGEGSVINVFQPTSITSNDGDGVFLNDTSVFSSNGPTSITDNQGWGVVCASPSVAQIVTSSPLNATGNGLGQISCP